MMFFYMDYFVISKRISLDDKTSDNVIGYICIIVPIFKFSIHFEDFLTPKIDLF